MTEFLASSHISQLVSFHTCTNRFGVAKGAGLVFLLTVDVKVVYLCSNAVLLHQGLLGEMELQGVVRGDGDVEAPVQMCVCVIPSLPHLAK